MSVGHHTSTWAHPLAHPPTRARADRDIAATRGDSANGQQFAPKRCRTCLDGRYTNRHHAHSGACYWTRPRAMSSPAQRPTRRSLPRVGAFRRGHSARALAQHWCPPPGARALGIQRQSRDDANLFMHDAHGSKPLFMAQMRLLSGASEELSKAAPPRCLLAMQRADGSTSLPSTDSRVLGLTYLPAMISHGAAH